MTPVILKYRDRFRRSPQLAINFGELAIDNFAGGGGASTGIEAALGRPVDIAINHDPGVVPKRGNEQCKFSRTITLL